MPLEVGGSLEFEARLVDTVSSGTGSSIYTEKPCLYYYYLLQFTLYPGWAAPPSSSPNPTKKPCLGKQNKNTSICNIIFETSCMCAFTHMRGREINRSVREMVCVSEKKRGVVFVP